MKGCRGGDNGGSQTHGKRGLSLSCLWTLKLTPQTGSWCLQNAVTVCHTPKQDLVFNTSILQGWALFPSLANEKLTPDQENQLISVFSLSNQMNQEALFCWLFLGNRDRVHKSALWELAVLEGLC